MLKKSPINERGKFGNWSGRKDETKRQQVRNKVLYFVWAKLQFDSQKFGDNFKLGYPWPVQSEFFNARSL